MKTTRPIHTILIADDDVDWLELITEYLSRKNFEIITAHNGTEAVKNIEKYAGQIHLAVLDIMLPYVDGFSVCRHIRNHLVISAIPILFITATNGEEEEIKAFNKGADALLNKPTSLRLIGTWIQSLLNRQNPQTATWVQYHSLYIDLQSEDFFIKNRKIDLTPTEYKLIKLFLRNPKTIYSRQEIMDAIFKTERYVFDRTIDTHIGNLRTKMKAKSKFIKTYRGLGYGLAK
jgi:two-component system phosphate regulon response regulator PhoB